MSHKRDERSATPRAKAKADEALSAPALAVVMGIPAAAAAPPMTEGRVAAARAGEAPLMTVEPVAGRRAGAAPLMTAERVAAAGQACEPW